VPRIAIVNDVAGVATAEARALRGSGWDADFFDVAKPAARWPRWAKPLTAPLRFAVALPLILRLRRGGYDIVHVHFVSQGYIGALSGRPFVLHAHGSDLHRNLQNSLYRAWTRLWMRRARAIFYVTPNLRPFLGDFAAKSRLVPNPVDTERFASIPPPAVVARVLVFMRLEPVKGAEAVFAGVDGIARVVEVAAMAWGPLASSLKQTYGGRVTFIETVPHDAVPSLLSRFDAVIGQMLQGVPGLSELEAMASGRLVLMRLDASLYPQDLPPVVSVADAGEIVPALERLRNDPAEVARISRAGRDWVEAHHSLGAHVDALKAAYLEAMRR
jgi:glycosyltransferase involved in cell wall biosynthesis